MRVQLNVQGMSQYNKEVNAHYQNSACGPTTVSVILNYHGLEQTKDINTLYKLLGGTKIGLFTWRLIKIYEKS